MKVRGIKKILRFSMKPIVIASMAIGIVLAVISCGQKDGNSNGVPVGYGTLGNVTLTNCSTCTSTIMRPMAIEFFDSSNMYGTLNFSKVQLIINGMGFTSGLSSSYNLYSGPVAIQGQMTVSRVISDSMVGACIVQPGTYYFQTASVGSMSMGSLQVPELVTTVGNIHLKLSQGLLYKNTSTQSHRFFGSVAVTSVNGVRCSMNFTDLLN